MNEIISKVKFALLEKYTAGSLDDELINDCINSTLDAINYNRCCTELPTNEETNIEIKRLTDNYYNDEMSKYRKSAFGLGFSTGVGFCKTHIKK